MNKNVFCVIQKVQFKESFKYSKRLFLILNFGDRVLFWGQSFFQLNIKFCRFGQNNLNFLIKDLNLFRVLLIV